MAAEPLLTTYFFNWTHAIVYGSGSSNQLRRFSVTRITQCHENLADYENE